MTRTVIDENTVLGDRTGLLVATNYGGHFNRLLNAGAFRATNVGGTGNAITARIDQEFFAGGLSAGQKVSWIQPAQNATANVTIALEPYDMDADPVVSAGSAVTYNVLDDEGNALAAGALASGILVTGEVEGGAIRVTSGAIKGSAEDSFFFQYIASDTWQRPTGLSDNRLAIVICWGAGGGGRSGASNVPGGGGGAGVVGEFRLGAIPSSVAVTVPAGGAINTDGGNCTFGSLLTGYGGKAGTSAGAGGDGGGHVANGDGGGLGNVAGAPGRTESQLGGGAGGANNTDGGSAFYGGGGGGGGTTGSANAGGVSQFGGNGGDRGAAGQAPGGGGGGGAAGARGECWVLI